MLWLWELISNIMLKSIKIFKLVYWFMLSTLIILPNDLIYAQDLDEEGEMFWGDEEEYEDDEEDYEDDEEEYEDDEEEYEDDEEESMKMMRKSMKMMKKSMKMILDSVNINLADEAENMGWSIDISGSAPRFVNESLMTWNSSINVRASIEAPFLMQAMGMRFRFGAELGTFGFEDALPQNSRVKRYNCNGNYFISSRAWEN